MTGRSADLEERTRHFTGRRWVFDALHAWLSSDAGSRVFLLTGGPGTGKSAIAARLAQMNLGQVEAAHSSLGKDRLAYVHFCQRGVEDSLSPLSFVQSLSQALANRYPAFRQALEKRGSRQIVINAVQTFEKLEPGAQAIAANIGQINIEIKGGDARARFDEAVRLPLRELAGGLGTGDRVVILVDSLDEALGFGLENNIVQLLAVAADFAAPVRFILTCRSNSHRVFELVGNSTLDLIADAPAALDEVTPYVTARLQGVREPELSVAAARIAAKSQGNFLYAHHVVEELLSRGGAIADADTRDLPATLEGVYRQSLERGLASSLTRWNDAYRPILGAIAVARGDGLTKAQLVEITGLAEDTTSDVLSVSAQFLLGGDDSVPYRIYHQSFREFLLEDEKFPVFPAERHAAIARYLQDRCGASWNRCTDDYALRYAPAHWADAAALSPAKRDVRTQALIALVADARYQQRFESRISDLPLLHAHVHRAVQVAALNQHDHMLPSIVKAAKAFVAFRREYLRSESLVSLAEAGRLAAAEARLPLFADVGEDWQGVARLVLAWLAGERNPAAAAEVRDSMAGTPPGPPPMPLLLARMKAALTGTLEFEADKGMAPPIEVGQQLVKRISGQDFDREMLGAINPSLIAAAGVPEAAATQGFASAVDGPMLVNLAREQGAEGTMLVDEYIDAHAGYNYIEYRNKSLWYVLIAVLHHHPDQQWVKTRLRKLLVAALSGGGVDFEEMLPLTAAILLNQASGGGGSSELDGFEQQALRAADALQDRRGANDSWGSHRRRLTALMELAHLLLGDGARTARLFQRISALPDGFAGFQAPARLRLADALRACRMNQAGAVEQTLDQALRSAHHIQDYHFCARVTARCNALTRWHRRTLDGAELAAAIGRLSRSPNDVEFAADHVIGEPYAYRPRTQDMLSVAPASDAATLEQLVGIFQRSSVDFRRLNPTHVSEVLGPGTPIHVPDPGLAPLLAVHLAARALADDAIADDRVALVRSLLPVAAINPTALDTLLSYFVVAADLQDTGLLEQIVEEAGPVFLTDMAAPTGQIGPDAVVPA